MMILMYFFFFSSRRRHTRCYRDWSSDVCSSDLYRAAGYLHADRKRMIDEDMAQFARMGWDGLRLTFWGDWEASDSAGNLIVNEHLDLLDYLIARARERGIYMLFSPIQLYGSNWPDALDDSSAPVRVATVRK